MVRSASPPPPAGQLQLQALFPLALGQVQLRPDPLDTAIQIQAIQSWRGEARSNPDPLCAWTGDLHGCSDLHRQAVFQPLLQRIGVEAQRFLRELGFQSDRLTLHIQRSWPVVSEAGQVIGRHHHPNAHLSAVYYLNGDGQGRSGCLRLYPPSQCNELVPGLAVGHGGPIAASSPAAALWNAPWHDIAPRAGLLLLFPANLDHAVLENGDPDDHRYSISVDFLLTSRPGAAADSAEYLAPHPSTWHELAGDS